MDRREMIGKLIGAGAVGTGAIWLSGCESLEQRLTHPVIPHTLFSPDMVSTTGSAATQAAAEFKILNRIAFGPRPGDIAELETAGMPAYLEKQLSPDDIAEEPTLEWRIRSLGDGLNADPGLLFDMDDHKLVGVLRQAAVLRAVYSKRQLYERMVEFWSDHFNIYAYKGQGPQLKMVDDRETIRKHALGRFRDLLGASAHSAAMLGYLDNTSNRRGAPNENYARELMELHTLGVHGGYTQRDVHEVARCLTGWTSPSHWRRGEFRFDSGIHDDAAKQVLGVAIPAGGGAADGERVLDILSAHPATAAHIARKLCIRFLGYCPEDLVSRLAVTFERSSGDIREVLRTLLTDENVSQSPPILKRPFDLMVSALRALEADTDGGADLQAHLEQMGQPSFGWPMPNGYPEKPEAWTGAQIPRWNYALALAEGRIANTAIDFEALADAGRRQGQGLRDTILRLALGRSSGSDVDLIRAAADRYSDSRTFAALVLISPAFQWR